MTMRNEELEMRNGKRMNKEQGAKSKVRHASLGSSFLCSLLFAICSLVFACQNPLSVPKAENIPAGKGSFSITVNVARTILPTLDESKFVRYTLDFKPSSGSMVREERNPADLVDPVYLEPGTYSLVVTAYFDTGKTKLAARGTLDNVMISEGKSVAGTVTLKAIIDSGTGTFTYTVIFPDVETAKMNITSLKAGSQGQDHSLSSGVTGKLTLNSGYYNVVFTLKKNNDDTLIWRELLHIYAGLESSFGMEFYDTDFFKTIYTVTLEFDNGDSNGKDSVVHGGKAIRPPNPTKDSYTFGGWYSDEGLTTVYDFASPVVSDIILYAKWNVILVTGVTLDKTTLSLIVGGATGTLIATVAPANALNKTVSWSSSTPSVATVLNGTATSGTVTAVGPGSATITVTTADGNKTATCTVTVTQPVTSVTLNPTTLNLTIGGTTTGTLTATVLPNNATNKAVTWTTNNDAVATVNNGVVTAVNGGITTITVRTADGGYTATCDVTVTVPGWNDEDFGSGATINNTFKVSNLDEWNVAASTISGGGNDKNYIINVIGNFTVPGATTNTFGSVTDIKVSLRGAGRTVGLSSNGNLIRTGAKQTLILRDLTLQGIASNNNAVVIVTYTSAFVMHSGRITGNTNNGNSGGVYTLGTFTMHGGEISYNTGGSGGGVLASETFIMHGGEISNNTSTFGGGGVLVLGTFTMHGGKISRNTATTSGGGVNVSGDIDGTFTMHGGEISYNTSNAYGGGVNVNQGKVRLVTGTIYGSNEDVPSLRNTARYLGSAALYSDNDGSGTAQRGTFNGPGGGWVSSGDLATTDNTIKVVEGVLQP